MSATLLIGALRLHVDDDGTVSPKGIAWSVKISSSRKIDKKVGEKEDDATTTDKGREAREVTLSFSWNDDADSWARAKPLIDATEVSNPKPGDPPAFGYERNGYDIAAAKNVRAIKPEKCKGPDADEASGKVTYELTCSSWAKPKPSAGAGTAKQAGKFVDGSAVKDFGGIPGNTVVFPPGTLQPPKVKP